MLQAPTSNEVEAVFRRVLSGEISRDEADRWAAKWIAADKPPGMPEATWDALKKLCGCDLRHGPDEDYLHDDRQLEEWLHEFLRSDGT